MKKLRVAMEVTIIEYRMITCSKIEKYVLGNNNLRSEDYRSVLIKYLIHPYVELNAVDVYQILEKHLWMPNI